MPFQNMWQHLSRHDRARLPYMYMYTVLGNNSPPTVCLCYIPQRLSATRRSFAERDS